VARKYDLQVLSRAVSSARRAVEMARHRQRSPGAPDAQQELLSALEGYSAELTRRGQPIPYRLRDELAMYRLLLQARRRGRG